MNILIGEAIGIFCLFLFLHLFCREAVEEKLNLRKLESPSTKRYKEKGLDSLLS